MKPPRPKKQSASAANERASTALIGERDSRQLGETQLRLEPIHTATVAGEATRYAIHGVAVLDQLEASGHQIVDENGNWIGILAEPGRVIHHQCQSHEEVRDIVASLNRTRQQKGGLQ